MHKVFQKGYVPNTQPAASQLFIQLRAAHYCLLFG